MTKKYSLKDIVERPNTIHKHDKKTVFNPFVSVMKAFNFYIEAQAYVAIGLIIFAALTVLLDLADIFF